MKILWRDRQYNLFMSYYMHVIHALMLHTYKYIPNIRIHQEKEKKKKNKKLHTTNE